MEAVLFYLHLGPQEVVLAVVGEEARQMDSWKKLRLVEEEVAGEVV